MTRRDAPRPGSTVSEEVAEETALLAELGLLTSSLVHELRQPLFAIRAIAQLLDVAGDADRERLTELLAQVDYARRLIDHYADFGGTGGAEVLLDLNDPIRAAIEMLAHRVRPKGITLLIDLAPGPILVRARRLALRQITVNLLTNAIDAVDGLAERTIGIRTRAAGDHALLVVEDTGGGLPRHLRDRAFDAYVTSKRPGQGTGLGLAIVRRLVDEGGGSVALLDGVSRGTRAEVRWPRVVIQG